MPTPVVSVTLVPQNVLVAVRVMLPIEAFVVLFVVIDSAPESVMVDTTAPAPQHPPSYPCSP